MGLSPVQPAHESMQLPRQSLRDYTSTASSGRAVSRQGIRPVIFKRRRPAKPGLNSDGVSLRPNDPQPEAGTTIAQPAGSAEPGAEERPPKPGSPERLGTTEWTRPAGRSGSTTSWIQPPIDRRSGKHSNRTFQPHEKPHCLPPASRSLRRGHAAARPGSEDRPRTVDISAAQPGLHRSSRPPGATEGASGDGTSQPGKEHLRQVPGGGTHFDRFEPPC